MAGVKGRSGGARPNSGPKPKKPRKTKAAAYQTDDPDEFLKAAMRDPAVDFKDRMAAALALKKTSKGGAAIGKKDQQQQAARDIVTRDLAPSPAPSRPRLVSVK